MQGFPKLTVEYNQHLFFLTLLYLYTVAYTYSVLEVRLSTSVILRPRDRIVKGIVVPWKLYIPAFYVTLMINASCLRELTFHV